MSSPAQQQIPPVVCGIVRGYSSSALMPDNRARQSGRRRRPSCNTVTLGTRPRALGGISVTWNLRRVVITCRHRDTWHVAALNVFD